MRLHAGRHFPARNRVEPRLLLWPQPVEETVMNKRQTLVRRAAGAFLAASAGFGLLGCAMTSADEGLDANPPFAAGWQQHSKPLYYMGPGPTAGSAMWMVSALTPRGTYQVISRQGDRAKLIDGHRFEVDGTVNKEIRLILPTGMNDLEVLDERYVLKQAPTKPAS